MQISRPADLCSVCLVSRELRSFATAPLYRRVSLTVGGSRDLLLSAMLGRDNPGLKHVREITIHLKKACPPTRNGRDVIDYSSSEDDDDSPVRVRLSAKQAHFTVRLLLDFLPPDILEAFKYVRISSEVDDFVR